MSLKTEIFNATAPEVVKERIASRRRSLVDLGFDADCCYSDNDVKIIVSEDDMLAPEEEWQTFIDETREKLQKPFPSMEAEETESPYSKEQQLAQAVLFDFEEWSHLNNRDLSKESINDFVKTLQ